MGFGSFLAGMAMGAALEEKALEQKRRMAAYEKAHPDNIFIPSESEVNDWFENSDKYYNVNYPY